MNRIKHLLILLLFSMLITACNNDDDCEITCQNDGILTIDCECVCQDGYKGEFCEEQEACNLVCENGGQLTPFCFCNCPSEYEGESCENCRNKFSLQNTGTVHPGGTNYSDDVEIRLPDNYFMTGIGLTIPGTLILTGRELFEDGILGVPVEFRAGEQADETPVISYTVPDGNVISGIGYGEEAGGHRLAVWYNELIIQDCEASLGGEELHDDNTSANGVLFDFLLNIEIQNRAFGGLGMSYNPSQFETQSRRLISD